MQLVARVANLVLVLPKIATAVEISEVFFIKIVLQTIYLHALRYIFVVKVQKE